MLNVPPFHPDMNARLLPEPCRVRFPLILVTRSPCDLEVPQDLRHKLAHLQQRDILTDASSTSVTELAWSVTYIAERGTVSQSRLTARKFRSIVFNWSGEASIHRSGRN